MTDSGTRREIAFVEGIPEVALSFEVPGGWSPEPGGGTVALAALRPKEVSGPFMDNVVVTIERLDEGMVDAYLTAIPAVRLRPEVAGVPIPKGQLVFVSLPSANRDPAFVEAPESLDIGRGAPGHLAFGHGVHHCLGAPLARMEMRIAFPALLRRFPRLALAVPYEELAFRAHHFVYGLRALPVTW